MQKIGFPTMKSLDQIRSMAESDSKNRFFFTAEKSAKEQTSTKSDLRLAYSKLKKSVDHVLALKDILQNAKLRVMQKEEETKFPSTKTLCDQLTETLQHLASQIQQAEKDKERFEFKFSTIAEAINSLKHQMQDLSVKLSASEENIKSREKELEELQLEKGQKENSYQNEQCRTASFSNEKDAMIKNSEAAIDEAKLNIENLNFRIEKVKLELTSKEDEGKYLVGVKEKLEQENMSIQLSADNLSEYIEAMIRHSRDIIKDEKVTETIARDHEHTLLWDDVHVYSFGEEGDTSEDDDYDDAEEEGDVNTKKGIDDQCEERAWKRSAHLRSVSSSSVGAKEDASDTDPEEYRGYISCPKRSDILKILAFHPENLANYTGLPSTLPSRLSLYYAGMCLSEERFELLKQSDPQGEIGVSDTSGRVYMFWKPRRLNEKHLFTEKKVKKREVVSGDIRDQLLHSLCWAYSLCDMVSASLVLHGWEKKFTPLCPRYLCEKVRPDLYGKQLEEDADLNSFTVHSCYGLSLEDGLAYVQDNGIPKEKHARFNCNFKRTSDPGEEMYHITDVFKYETMEQALVRLKSHPVAAKLVLFEGWSSDRIYRGPSKKGAQYVGEHEVLMLDCVLKDGEMVVRCKSSNGERIGVSGYIFVSLEVMFLLAGKDERRVCFKEPQYLLSCFFSIGMETGPLGLKFKEKPNRKRTNLKKFKVVLKKRTTDSESSELGFMGKEHGSMIAEEMSRVGRKGVVILEEGKSAENALYVVEEMQFDSGYVSPYFLTDSEKMSVEFDNCKLLLVDKKITYARDLVGVLEDAIRGGYPILIIAEDFEQEALATLVVNKLRGTLKIAALKAPGFGERKRRYLDDIAILTGATVIREEVGLSLDKAGKEVLGHAAKVVLTKGTSTIVGEGSTQDAVQKRVTQIKNLIEQAEQEYEKEKLNERIAKLSGGVAVIQVGAQTETELKEKKLRVEDALNATKAAVEEGFVGGGGCTLLRLASKVGADIVKRALSYPLKLIAKNAGVNGSVVLDC